MLNSKPVCVSLYQHSSTEHMLIQTIKVHLYDMRVSLYQSYHRTQYTPYELISALLSRLMY